MEGGEVVNLDQLRAKWQAESDDHDARMGYDRTPGSPTASTVSREYLRIFIMDIFLEIREAERQTRLETARKG